MSSDSSPFSEIEDDFDIIEAAAEKIDPLANIVEINVKVDALVAEVDLTNAVEDVVQIVSDVAPAADVPVEIVPNLVQAVVQTVQLAVREAHPSDRVCCLPWWR
jgi:hypothetical protein